MPARAENCADTGLVALAAIDCRGAFVGSLSGSPAGNVALVTAWGGTWSFAGMSDDSGNDPFNCNPQIAFSGALVFALAVDTTEGVATSIQGNPLALSHAALYVSAVPEASTGAMLLAGLLAVGWLAARRR